MATRKPKETAADTSATDTVTIDLPFDPTPAANETTPAAPGHALATLPPAQRAVIVLNSAKAEQELREMVVKSSGIMTVVDANGREEAHRAGMGLKNARVAIKNTGKAARDDANAFCTAVIAEEKRLVSIIETEEERIFKLRDDFDAKVKAEKEEAERRERERVAKIRANIETISAYTKDALPKSAADLHTLCSALAQVIIAEADYAEFTAEAQRVLDETGARLATLYREAKAREEEAARLAAEAEAQRIEAARLAVERAAQEQASAALAAQQAEQKRAMEAVQQAQALGATTGNAFSLQRAIDALDAIPDFEPPMGGMVLMAKSMAKEGLLLRFLAEQERAAQERLNQIKRDLDAQARAIREEVLSGPAPAPASAQIDGDAPAPTDWDAPPAPALLPLPEHVSVLDEQIDAGLLPADADAAQRFKDAALELYASRGAQGVRDLLDEVLDGLAKQEAQDLAA